MRDEDLLVLLLIPMLLSVWSGSAVQPWENFLSLFDR
jgi:hypothetical protein